MARISDEQSACAFVVGEDGLARWSDLHADAWIGLLESHKQLTRLLEADLETRYGLGLSGLELLGRLAASAVGRLRLSELAAACALSLSRVSRLVDALEDRGLVARRPCAEDGRAIEAELTDAGLSLVREAQATHVRAVQERFFDQLTRDEIETLAAVFGRLSTRESRACTTD